MENNAAATKNKQSDSLCAGELNQFDSESNGIELGVKSLFFLLLIGLV